MSVASKNFALPSQWHSAVWIFVASGYDARAASNAAARILYGPSNDRSMFDPDALTCHASPSIDQQKSLRSFAIVTLHGQEALAPQVRRRRSRPTRHVCTK